MDYISVRNWEKHQTKMSNGNPPPWIKVHKKLLTSARWAMLSDAEKGQLISMWLIASDRCGLMPVDAGVIQKVCGLDDAPNLSKFIELGFLQTSCEHDVKKMSPERRGEERRKSITSNAPSSRFDEFWAAYPKKVEKKKARQKWKARNLDRLADQILNDIETRKAKDRKWLEGYIPNPTTYINGDRWEDEMQTDERVPTDHSAIRSLLAANGIDGRAMSDWQEARRAIAQATGMRL